MNQFHSKDVDHLFETILSLKNVDECYQFFNDLCTIKEILDMSSRLQIAELLHQKNSYQKVSELAGVSSATVCRVKKCLEYGTGYQLVIQRELEKSNQNGNK